MTVAALRKPWQRHRKLDLRSIFRGGVEGGVYGSQDPNVLLSGAAAAGAATYMAVNRYELIDAWAESTGVTPVTAVETARGLAMDRSQGLVPGTDIRSTGVVGLVGTATAATFNTGTGAGSVTRAADSLNQSYVSITVLAGVAYRVRISVAGATLGIRRTTGGTVLSTLLAGFDGYTTVISDTTTLIFAATGNGTTSTFTLTSCVPIPGNHLIQATAASRPVLSQRVNQLLATAVMSTQSVTVVAASQKLSFTGTGTVTLTGVSTAGPLVGTGANDRVSLTFTPTAGSLTLTVSGSVTLADLRLTSDAAFDIPPYQGVVSASVYDTDGFPAYDKFDGTDDHRTCATGGGSTTGFFWCGVVTVQGGAGTTREVWDDRSSAVLGLVAAVSPTNGLTISLGNGASSIAVATAADTVVVGNTYVLTAWYDGLNGYVQINNQTPVASAAVTLAAGSAGFAESKNNTVSSGYFNGRMYGRIFTRNYCPTASQREQIKRRLALEARCTHLLA